MPRTNGHDKKVLDDAVQKFVRDVLGCKCPDEVFETIECSTPVGHPTGPLVSIAGRLMVRFIPVDNRIKAPSLNSKSILELLDAGRQMRDRKGYNRFRLVIVCRGGTGRFKHLIDETQRSFTGSILDDGRAHLHFENLKAVPLPIRRRLCF